MFPCDKCGLCCRSIKEIEMLAYMDRGDGVCVHLDDHTNLCTIYAQRPLLCRVEEAYEEYFKADLSKEEYYELNHNACIILKKRRRKMSDIKNALIDKWKEINGGTYFTINDCYNSSDISNAVSIICQGKCKRDDMVLIFATDFNNKAKAGLVMGVDGVYLNTNFSSTTKFIAKYEDIDYTDLNEDRFLGQDITTLDLHMKYGSIYKISNVNVGLRSLQRFIDYAVSLYKDNDKLEW